MTRYYATPEGQVAFTTQEETIRDAEEQVWLDEAPIRAFEKLRKERDAKLAESDYMGNTDVVMSEEWRIYRQALRDLPSTLDNTTVLGTIVFPTEPT